LILSDAASYRFSFVSVFLIDSLIKDPMGTVNAELASVFVKVVPALKPVTEQLKAAGVDKDVLMLDVDGVTKLTSDVMAANFTDLLSVSLHILRSFFY
jgi:hypothetical protein